jgi:hypothetical protein
LGVYGSVAYRDKKIVGGVFVRFRAPLHWPFQVIYIPIFLWAFLFYESKIFFSLMPLIQLSKNGGLLWYQKKQFII